MHRIFLRVLLLSAFSIVIAAVAINYTINRIFETQIEALVLKQAAGQIFLIERYLEDAPASEWTKRFEKIREASHLTMELIDMSEARIAIPARKLAALTRGDVVTNQENSIFYRRVDLAGQKFPGSENKIMRVKEIVPEASFMTQLQAFQIFVVALCVLIPIALWSRSHWRELQAMSVVAEDFGNGRLSTRAKVKKTATVYPLAQCLNVMAERIERLIGAHRDLLHSVSHELRTPIARLEFGLELLRKAAKDNALEPRIKAMEGDVAELNGMVNELLNLAKLDQQQSARHVSFVMADALHQTVDSLEHEFGNTQLTMTVSGSLGNCIGDQSLIERALRNLLKNAAKYADHRVAVSAIRSADDLIEIVVEDDGPGIPEEDRERIFEPFFRLDRSRDRSTGGFGLGLSIAQKAVALHGGTISVTTSELGGAKFMLVVPAVSQRLDKDHCPLINR